MSLFFRSKKFIVVLQGSVSDTFLAESASHPDPTKSIRFEQLVFALLSEPESGDSELSEIKEAARLLEEFEKDWNKPGRTVDEATTQVFFLLKVLGAFPKIKKIISDDCLSEFFLGAVNIEKCLDFERINEDQDNLMAMSSRLSYVQLAICFFEIQMSPYWSLPTDVFFQNIFYTPPECTSATHINKLSRLLLLSECVFNTVKSNKEGPKANPAAYFLMQKHLKRIRCIFGLILSYSSSLEDELSYIGRNEEFFLKIEGFKKSIHPSLVRFPEVLILLQQAFGDVIEVREGLDSRDPVKVRFASLASESHTTSSKGVYQLIKGFVDKGDFKSIYEFQIKFQRANAVLKKAIIEEDASSGSSLLNDMLAIFDNKKLAKGKSPLSTDNLNKAGYIDRIIYLLFPNIEERVNFFTRLPLPKSLSNTSLGNLITCELILLSVFNDTNYYKDSSSSLKIFKAKIEENLISVLEHPFVFSNSFHVLYFLAYKNSKFHPGLQKLLDDLNFVLEVIREGGEKFSDIRSKLLDNEDEDYPLESTRVIQRLIDKKLWDEDQAEEIRLLEESFKEPEQSTPPASAKKKKKKAAAPVAKEDAESVATTTYHTLAPKESLKKIPPADVKKVVAPMPALLLAKASPPVITSSLLIKDEADIAIQRATISEMTIAKIERFSELNRLILANLDAFRDEIQLHLSQMTARGFTEQKELMDLDNCLEERQNIIRGLRGYFKKARSNSHISFSLKPLTTEPFLLLDDLLLKVRKHQEPLSSLIDELLSIEEDKSSTLSIHLPALIDVLRSTSIPVISLGQVRSYQFLLRFRSIISDIKEEFTPVLTCILNNESFYPLGEVAIDAKNFGQLILQVQNWSTDPFYMYELKDTPPFLFQIKRNAPDSVNPVADLSAHLSHLVIKWNHEINRFAMVLSKVIPFERESTFITEMKIFCDKLSYSYFKDRDYPCMALLNRLFHPLAEVELYGSQLVMRDLICDIDVRLKWHIHHDSFENVVGKIKFALTKEFGPKADVGLKALVRKLYHANGSYVDVLKINVPIGGFFPLSLDLSIFVGNDFPLVSYASHAAGILNTRTGRMRYPHHFFANVLNNVLEIEEPSCKDFSDKARCSRLTHVLKLIVRATYSQLPQEKLFLGDLAAKMLKEITLYKSDIAGLQKAKPHLVEALHFLLEQHFEHFELTTAFFKRTAVLLAFYQDLGCKLVAVDGMRKLQFIAVNSKTLQLNCMVLADSEKLPVAKDVSSNAFLVILPKDLLKCVSPMFQVSTMPAALFSQTAAAGAVGRIASGEDTKVAKL